MYLQEAALLQNSSPHTASDCARSPLGIAEAALVFQGSMRTRPLPPQVSSSVVQDDPSHARPMSCERSLVRAKGLEPPQLAPLEPKSSASTNSATPARGRPARTRTGNQTVMTGRLSPLSYRPHH